MGATTLPLTDDIVASAIRSAVPRKLRSGNAARKSVMNA